jgi:hypothetical protein
MKVIGSRIQVNRSFCLLCEPIELLTPRFHPGNQTYTAITQLNCKRRVILTGTPIQVRRFAAAAFGCDVQLITPVVRTI